MHAQLLQTELQSLDSFVYKLTQYANYVIWSQREMLTVLSKGISSPLLFLKIMSILIIQRLTKTYIKTVEIKHPWICP